MTHKSAAFFGRRDVLGALRGHLGAVTATGRGRIVAVQGRRQVGKSTAIERFVESATVPHAFVAGVFQARLSRALADATQALTDSTRPVVDADLLAQAPATSWSDWLGKVALAARNGPVIVVLDEFPWLAASDASMEGTLQAAWDRVLQKLPVLLILVGSDVAMMDALASHGRPLYGRVSPLVVPPLNPADVAAALPRWKPFDVFDAYLVSGGYPRLVLDIATSRASTITDYVTSAFADLYSPLVTTARLSLDAEFTEPQIAYQVLSAIGANETTNPGFNDILGTIADADERKRTETAITRALKTLTETKRLVRRETPAWSAPSSKLRRYRVTDPYLRFWFRYIEQNVDRIARGRSDLAVAAFARDWESWRGRSIEPVVREALVRMAAMGGPGLDGVEDVRPWWVRDNSIEIDIVAMAAERTTLVGTVKWRRAAAVSQLEVADLQRQRAFVPRSEGALIAAVSPSGKAAKDADITFSAADLLTAWA